MKVNKERLSEIYREKKRENNHHIAERERRRRERERNREKEKRWEAPNNNDHLLERDETIERERGKKRWKTPDNNHHIVKQGETIGRGKIETGREREREKRER